MHLGINSRNQMTIRDTWFGKCHF